MKALPDKKLYFMDFETRSTEIESIKGQNTAVFAAQSDVLILSYGTRREDIKTWTVHDDEMPEDLFEHVRNGGDIVAHNAFFELCAWNYSLRRMFPMTPEMKPENVLCTLNKCNYYCIPESLEGAAKFLKIKDQKKAGLGKELVDKYCGPRSPDLFQNPEDLERMIEYCEADVAACIGIWEALSPVIPKMEWARERFAFCLNYRGLPTDKELLGILLEHAEPIIPSLKTRYADELRFNLTQNKKCLEYLSSAFGVVLPDAKKETKAKALVRGDVPDGAKEFIKYWILSGKSSVTKVAAINKALFRDNTVKGAFKVCGAHTHRFSGRDPQPQNMPKGFTYKGGQIYEKIKSIKAGSLSDLKMEDKIDEIVGVLRGLMAVPEGWVGYQADYSAVECRGVAFLAGEEELLSAFRRKECAYCVMASYIYQKPINKEEHPKEREFGKIVVLGCGYQMGYFQLLFVLLEKTVLRFSLEEAVTIAGGEDEYLRHVEEITAAMYRSSRRTVSGSDLGLEGTNEGVRVIDELQDFGDNEYDSPIISSSKPSPYDRFKNELGVDLLTVMPTIVAMKVGVEVYREKYKKIVGLWDSIEEYAKKAVANFGKTYSCAEGRIRFKYNKERDVLILMIPTGDYMLYHNPRLRWSNLEEYKDPADGKIKKGIRVERKKDGKVFHIKPTLENSTLVFRRVNKPGGGRSYGILYGGCLTENACQFMCRCITESAAVKLEEEGFNPWLLVHDEALGMVRESEKHEKTLKKFEECLLSLPAGLEDFPLAVEGKEVYVYAK